jgi:hypothetical protein
MLKCETNTKAVERAIRGAFADYSRKRSVKGVDVFFEHGQWFLVHHNEYTDHTYSVVDATGPNSYRGFGFEQLD